MIHDVLRVGRGDASPTDLAGDVRSFSKGCLARALGVPVGDLEIRKRGRIPELWLRGAPSTVDLSLSHHGGFVAFACEIGGASREAFGGSQ